LIELTRLIGQHLRLADILARWGGEEFMILMPHCGATEALQVADKLRVLVADHSFPEVGAITASLGVAEFQPHESANAWIKRADLALYAAKAAGRNRVCLAAREIG
jgi:diguanylate cyclase (GGDEF)-like protein